MNTGAQSWADGDGDDTARPIRVVHCLPIFSELTQTFVYELVSAMAASGTGIDVRVLTWHRRNPRDRPFEPVDVVKPPTRGEVRRIRLAGALPQRIASILVPPTRFERAMVDRLVRAQAEVVHAHFGPTAVLTARAARLAGARLVVTFRGRDASAKLKKWRWRLLYRRMLVHAAAATFVSQDLSRRLDPLMPANLFTRVILASKRSTTLAYRPPPRPGGRLVSVGRLIEKKGHGDAIRALARARELGVDACLTVIGDGPLRSALEAEIERLGVEESVELVGALAFDEVIAYLRAADFLIAANRTASNGDSEGVPNVVKEAQLLGLPVIATDHGGIAHAVAPEHRDGLLVEGDVAGIAQRIAELNAAEPDTLAALAWRGREHVLATFDPGQEVIEYRSLYQRVRRQETPDSVSIPESKHALDQSD